MCFKNVEFIPGPGVGAIVVGGVNVSEIDNNKHDECNRHNNDTLNALSPISLFWLRCLPYCLFVCSLTYCCVFYRYMDKACHTGYHSIGHST